MNRGFPPDSYSPHGSMGTHGSPRLIGTSMPKAILDAITPCVSPCTTAFGALQLQVLGFHEAENNGEFMRIKWWQWLVGGFNMFWPSWKIWVKWVKKMFETTNQMEIFWDYHGILRFFSSWRLGWFNRALLNHQPILRVIANWSCFFNDVHLKSSINTYCINLLSYIIL